MPIQILMPALSPTMTEGNLVKWHKKEGDQVEIGDILAEIETDKATMEVESVDEGTLGKIFVKEGTEDVSVNTLIAALLEEGEDESALDDMGEKSVESSASSPKSSPEEQEKKLDKTKDTDGSNQGNADTKDEDDDKGKDSSDRDAETEPKKETSEDNRIFATPVAKRVAAQNDIDLSKIKGSGPKGRIIKADVEAAVDHQNSSEDQSVQKQADHQSATTSDASRSSQKRPIEGESVPADDLYPSYTKVKTTSMRKVIAKRLTESKQTVPHFYLTVNCHIDKLLAARAEMNHNVEKHEKISVNDFVIKAMACALMDVPEANASWGEDHVKIFDHADISVAVAIEGGLVTPILRHSESKSLGTLSMEMKSLAKKARDGKLKPQDFQGGTISLSNLGMFGIKEFSAVINPPQGCILAVGAGEKQAVVKEDGSISAATIMACTLSVDHRVVDGAIGAQFLKAFQAYIENPILMLK